MLVFCRVVDRHYERLDGGRMTGALITGIVILGLLIYLPVSHYKPDIFS